MIPTISSEISFLSRPSPPALDPDRPFLSDYLVFGLLQDSGLLILHHTTAEVRLWGLKAGPNRGILGPTLSVPPPPASNGYPLDVCRTVRALFHLLSNKP